MQPVQSPAFPTGRLLSPDSFIASSKKPVELQHLLEACFGSETVQLNCEECSPDTPVPHVFFACLRRSTDSGKNHVPVKVKPELSLGPKAKYFISGVVVHVGQVASQGHYTAWIRHPSNLDTWWHCDDMATANSHHSKLGAKAAEIVIVCLCQRSADLLLTVDDTEVPVRRCRTRATPRERKQAERTTGVVRKSYTVRIASGPHRCAQPNLNATRTKHHHRDINWQEVVAAVAGGMPIPQAVNQWFPEASSVRERRNALERVRSHVAKAQASVVLPQQGWHRRLLSATDEESLYAEVMKCQSKGTIVSLTALQVLARVHFGLEPTAKKFSYSWAKGVVLPLKFSILCQPPPQPACPTSSQCTV